MSTVKRLAKEQTTFLSSTLQNSPFSYELLHALRRAAVQLGITGKLTRWPAAQTQPFPSSTHGGANSRTAPMPAAPVKPSSASQSGTTRTKSGSARPSPVPAPSRGMSAPNGHKPMFSPVRSALKSQSSTESKPKPQSTSAAAGQASATKTAQPEEKAEAAPPKLQRERSVSFAPSEEDESGEREKLLKELAAPASPAPSARMSVRSTASTASGASRVLKPWQVKTVATVPEGKSVEQPSALDEFLLSQPRSAGKSVLSIKSQPRKSGLNRYMEGVQDAGEALRWALHEPFDIERDIETVFSLQPNKVEAEEKSSSQASPNPSAGSSPRHTMSPVGGAGTLYEGSIRASALGPMYNPRPGIQKERQDNMGESFARSLRVPEIVLQEQRRIEEEHWKQRQETGGRWIDTIHLQNKKDEYSEIPNPLLSSQRNKAGSKSKTSPEKPDPAGPIDPTLMFYRHRKRLAGRRSLLMRHFREAQELEEDRLEKEREAEEEKRRRVRILARTGYGMAARGLLAHDPYGEEEDDGRDDASGGTRATRTVIVEGSDNAAAFALNPPRPHHSAWADILQHWDGQ